MRLCQCNCCDYPATIEITIEVTIEMTIETSIAMIAENCHCSSTCLNFTMHTTRTFSQRCPGLAMPQEQRAKSKEQRAKSKEQRAKSNQPVVNKLPPIGVTAPNTVMPLTTSRYKEPQNNTVPASQAWPAIRKVRSDKCSSNATAASNANTCHI
jgi:hypothetical protein